MLPKMNLPRTRTVRGLQRYVFLLVLILFFIFIVLFLSQKDFYKQQVNKESVKGAITAPTIYITPTPTPTQQPTLTPTPTIIVLKKASYTIAIFGDSMVDTMGDNLEYLGKSLVNKYPLTEFKLYNYGIGGQNVEQGLGRFESTFSNKTRQYPPLPALHSDVIIIGSFAYNPFSIHDKNKHYTLLSQLVEKAKNIAPRVYVLAEIAPLKIGFGKGKNGVNWPEDMSKQQALQILEQLDNAVNVSSSQGVKLINAYHRSRIDGAFGSTYYVNPDDGIHPSAPGHTFMAELIAETLEFE